MKSSLLILLGVTILTGCNDLEIDINAEEERNKIVIQNEKETKSTLNTKGIKLKEAIETRNLDEIEMILENTSANNKKKVYDFIAEMEEQEAQIFESKNEERPVYDDDGNIISDVEKVTEEEVKGTLEYEEYFDRTNGSYEQFYYYTNEIYNMGLSIVWLGGSIYEIY